MMIGLARLYARQGVPYLTSQRPHRRLGYILTFGRRRDFDITDHLS